MTELELYKFIQENDVDIDRHGEELVAWISHYDLSDLTTMIGSALDDGGIDVNLQSSCIAIDIESVCVHFGIDPEVIHSRD